MGSLLLLLCGLQDLHRVLRTPPDGLVLAGGGDLQKRLLQARLKNLLAVLLRVRQRQQHADGFLVQGLGVRLQHCHQQVNASSIHDLSLTDGVALDAQLGGPHSSDLDSFDLRQQAPHHGGHGAGLHHDLLVLRALEHDVGQGGHGVLEAGRRRRLHQRHQRLHGPGLDNGLAVLGVHGRQLPQHLRCRHAFGVQLVRPQSSHLLATPLLGQLPERSICLLLHLDGRALHQVHQRRHRALLDDLVHGIGVLHT
mmetsp:Transcript_92932/g.266375  ORF Transcript_92932/g.266375 Transcript_92932/m.266375 type:complete len:253 (-) Transcript_92932:525-1283(-)